MILESALLDVEPGQADAFEQAFAKAQRIIAASPGYLGHELRRCLERPRSITRPSGPGIAPCSTK